MAHYAKLDETNTIIEVNVVDNSQEDFLGGETATVEWLKQGWGGIDWKKTSYNTIGNQHPTNNPFRKNYAGIGYTYDATRDAFIPLQPFPSWNLVEETCQWEAPIPYPIVPEGSFDYYTWNETTQAWDLVI